jgi:hypothetical protein
LLYLSYAFAVLSLLISYYFAIHIQFGEHVVKLDMTSDSKLRRYVRFDASEVANPILLLCRYKVAEQVILRFITRAGLNAFASSQGNSLWSEIDLEAVVGA